MAACTIRTKVFLESQFHKKSLHFQDTYKNLWCKGAVYRQCRQLGGGGVKNWSKLLTDSTKKLPTRGRGVSKIRKIDDIVYGWSQRTVTESLFTLKILYRAMFSKHVMIKNIHTLNMLVYQFVPNLSKDAHTHTAPSDLQHPLRQWSASHVYLSFLYKVKGKHCRKPHCRNGVVDHLEHSQ